MVSDGCNLIIGVGFNLEKAIHTSADEQGPAPRPRRLSFNDGNNNTVTVEGARPCSSTRPGRLPGRLRHMSMTKTGKVATFSGIQIPR